VDNAAIAAMFDEIAALLEAKKDNIFKIRAYRKAARSITALREPVTKLAAENRLAEIDGAGEAIQKKLAELVDTGRLDYLERLRAEQAEGGTRP
jgi:DNA polymerase (family 10)